MDVLLAVGDKPVTPEEGPMFPMGVELPIHVLRGCEEMTFKVSIPNPKSRKQPYAEPEPVVSKVLPGGVGYLKVAILPGLLGLDVARAIDRAVAELDACDRLILDLRGHVGGG